MLSLKAVCHTAQCSRVYTVMPNFPGAGALLLLSYSFETGGSGDWKVLHQKECSIKYVYHI